MFGTQPTLKTWIARRLRSPLLQYCGAAISIWLVVSLWALSPVFHRHLFVLLLAAVLFTARFLGFGPSIFCSIVSTACLDFFASPPIFSFAIRSPAEAERLGVFLFISVFAASMARQRKLAESRADRTTREMAAIVEYSCDAIYACRPDGTITSWNHAAEKLYGYTPEEAVGLPVERLAPADRREEVVKNLAVLNQGGEITSYRTERMRKDGTLCPVLLSVSPLRNAKGEIVGTSAIARDIAPEKQSEEAIRRSEKLATAGRMAASVAHEINNPLEAVLNLLYLARHDSSHSLKYLSMAEREVIRVAQIAQQTLGIVRDAHVPSPVDPAAMMDEILQLYSRKLTNRNIRVTRRYRSQLQVEGYSGELRQLLANLVVNAVDAMPERGCLQVRVAPGHSWSTGRAGVRVTISDNGSGISIKDLEHIFQPFFTTKKDTGTGLGLWVSRGIVEKHEGSIRVRSRTSGLKTGTVFFIFLPMHLRHSADRLQPGSSFSQNNLHSAKVQ